MEKTCQSKITNPDFAVEAAYDLTIETFEKTGYQERSAFTLWLDNTLIWRQSDGTPEMRQWGCMTFVAEDSCYRGV